MEEINVLDIFCGAGGMSEGFKQAGFNISYAIDNNKGALETYKKNHPNTEIIDKDIREVDFTELRKVNIIIGGPPCQGYSSLNSKKDSSESHENRIMMDYFFEAIKKIEPDVFVMENVSNICTYNKGKTLKKIYETAKELGYSLNHKLCDLSLFGVPQRRQRAIFIGSKIGNIQIMDKKDSTSVLTVEDAISDLYNQDVISNLNDDGVKYEFGCNNLYQKERRNKSTKIYNHIARGTSPKVEKKIKHLPQGQSLCKIDNTSSSRCDSYRRLDSNSPSITIYNISKAYIIHPKCDRILSVREGARIQGFDDTYIFYGTKTSQYQQIANAVPPIFCKYIANEIMTYLRHR